MQAWARLQAERTWNMRTMFLTLDVSKLSGRLNFHASCRESKGGHAMRGEVRAGGWEAERDRGARSVQGRARLQVGGPGTGERTWNMRSMVVTLEVSKLSGWLNFHASCRESNGGYTMWGEMQAEGWEGHGRRRCKQRAGVWIDCRLGARAQGGAHLEHAHHVSDAGRVEAQRPVELPRVLPRVERRAYDAGRGAGR